MEGIASDLSATMPDLRQLARVAVRLLAALLAGALIGYQRERIGKAAGLRTHILVAMGSSLFVIAAVEAGMSGEGLSRVIQGIVTGVGFLGAGTILKIVHEQEIRGLTTAADIWMTAAISIAIGLGQIGIGLISAVLAWIVLTVFSKFGRLQGDGKLEQR